MRLIRDGRAAWLKDKSKNEREYFSHLRGSREFRENRAHREYIHGVEKKKNADIE